jgi:hypothetical protein
MIRKYSCEQGQALLESTIAIPLSFALFVLILEFARLQHLKFNLQVGLQSLLPSIETQLKQSKNIHEFVHWKRKNEIILQLEAFSKKHSWGYLNIPLPITLGFEEKGEAPHKTYSVHLTACSVPFSYSIFLNSRSIPRETFERNCLGQFQSVNLLSQKIRIRESFSPGRTTFNPANNTTKDPNIQFGKLSASQILRTYILKQRDTP